jgi:hypothetical protein
VKFGEVSATASYWSRNVIVVRVPAGAIVGKAPVTVTPTGGTVSNAVSFVVDAPRSYGGDNDESGSMSPTGALGVQHLSMYNTYRATCAVCHDGVSQPQAPAISMEGANMKTGIACATCHAAGREESEKPLFISFMNDPTKIVYSRCSDCHQVTRSSDDD